MIQNPFNFKMFKRTNKMSLSSVLSLGILLIVPSCATAGDMDQESFNKAMDAYLSDEGNVEKLSNAIQGYFKKLQEKEAKQASKAQEQQMEDQFKNPIKIDAGDSPSKGPKDAKVTVIAFSDFQCPYCSKGKTIMEELVEAYPKDVKVVFKHLPLGFHPQAMPASKATVAADKQGKFWEMHDYIFDNQRSLDDDFYVKAAEAIGLDIEKFKKDFADPETEKTVNKDVELSKSLGVQGTPNFYVNGVHLRGAYPLPEFKKIVDKWLEKSK
jgi:protein-disulfide isomerase